MAEPAVLDNTILNPANVATGVIFILAVLGAIAQRFFKGFEATHPEEGRERVVLERSDFIDWVEFKDGQARQEILLRRIADSQDMIVTYERRKSEREDQAQIRAEERIKAQEEQSRLALQERLDRLAEAEETYRKTHQGRKPPAE